MNSLINFDTDSFSHGQVVSKLWLCNTLESFIPENARVAIVGSWYNVLAFMMLTRNEDRYQEILGIDINPDVASIANKVCNAWAIGTNPKVKNQSCDASNYDLSQYDVVINCSVEHMSDDWYGMIKKGTLVCIQSSDVTNPDYPWLISNPNQNIETLIKKYPLSRILFSNDLEINYSDWGYKRFMLIGLR